MEEFKEKARELALAHGLLEQDCMPTKYGEHGFSIHYAAAGTNRDKHAAH